MLIMASRQSTLAFLFVHVQPLEFLFILVVAEACIYFPTLKAKANKYIHIYYNILT